MLLAALMLAMAPPTVGQERGIVELGIAAEDVYPPKKKSTRAHPTYGFAVSASLRGKGSFKAMIGFEFDHLVGGWLGDPERGRTARAGVYEGTIPTTYRGQLFRMAPIFRVGIEKSSAYGYFGASPGYALRVASLVCANPPCQRPVAIDHGLHMAISLGAMVAPFDKYGFVFGGELGLDWAYFPAGHSALAPWNQGMSARFLAGYAF